MEKNSFYLATDFKNSFFSAVFSFEAGSKTFNSFDKYDLMHAYMVSQIIIKFEDIYNKDVNRSFGIENILSQIQNVVKNIKKSGVGSSAEKQLIYTAGVIKKKFPVETAKIDKILDDETGFTTCCFFLPVVLSDLLNEYELLKGKKKKMLFGVDVLNQLMNNETSYPCSVYDLTVNVMNSFSEDTSIKYGQEDIMIASREYLTRLAELHFVSTGEFMRYCSERKNNETKKTEEISE